MSELVRFDAVTAGYAAPVVGPVSFGVGRGEVVGLAGPNGCGKSTLAGALTGRARVFGGSLRRAPGLRIAHQAQGFEPIDGIPLNGRELLALTGAPPAGLPDWLAERLTQRLDRLSGGQVQFLRLWACLMQPADLVILDEPTNNLDRAGIRHLEGVLHRFDPARAALVISHDAAFLRAVAGHIVEVGG